MTYQRDPRRDPEHGDIPLGAEPASRNPRDYIRRDDGTWGALPVVAALVFVGILGWMFLTSGTSGPTSTTNTRVETPNTTTPGTAPRTIPTQPSK